jgi:hypothetical protein
MKAEDLFQLSNEEVWDMLVDGEISLQLFEEFVQLRCDRAVEFARSLDSLFVN